MVAFISLALAVQEVLRLYNERFYVYNVSSMFELSKSAWLFVIYITMFVLLFLALLIFISLFLVVLYFSRKSFKPDELGF